MSGPIWVRSILYLVSEQLFSKNYFNSSSNSESLKYNKLKNIIYIKSNMKILI
jgi:hypothetical protein